MSKSRPLNQVIHLVHKKKKETSAGVVYDTVDLTLTLKADADRLGTSALSGLSAKAVYVDQHGSEYIVKTIKPRSISTLFGISDEQLAIIQKSKPALYDKMFSHKMDVEQTQLLQEVLIPCLSRRIFGDFLQVPENFFYIDKQKEMPDRAFIISKKIEGFEEILKDKLTHFLQRKAGSKDIVRMPKEPSDWKFIECPKIEDLHITLDEAKVIGKILAFVYIFSAWDPWNNIDLSNSGSIKKDSVLKPVVVDMGNIGQMGGFGGKTQDETAAQNKEFLAAAKIDRRSEEKVLIDYANKNIEGFQHCVPFTKEVYPIPPRFILPELLYLMTGDEDQKEANPLGFAMFQGLEEGCKAMSRVLVDIEDRIKFSEEDVEEYINVDDLKHARELLESSFLEIEYLEDRIYSIIKLTNQLRNGMSMKTIAEQQLKLIGRLTNFEETTTGQSEFFKRAKVMSAANVKPGERAPGPKVSG